MAEQAVAAKNETVTENEVVQETRVEKEKNTKPEETKLQLENKETSSGVDGNAVIEEQNTKNIDINDSTNSQKINIPTDRS